MMVKQLIRKILIWVRGRSLGKRWGWVRIWGQEKSEESGGEQGRVRVG